MTLGSITVSGNTVYLEKSTDYADYFKSGKLMMKSARIAELKDNKTVIFDDGTTEQYDVIILCTGYKFSFPFLEEGLVTLSHRSKYWPLHKRVFSVKDPRLMFVGQHDTGFLKHFVTERQVIALTQYVAGKITLPSPEELQKELVESHLKYGYTDDNLHDFYRMVDHNKELSIINELHSLVPHMRLHKELLD